MNTPTLQHLLSLLISLLLMLVPTYNVVAQGKEKKEEPKTIRVKMFKSVDGKLVYSKDTVLNAADHEKHLETLTDFKFDSKTWKKLEGISLDSVKSLSFFRSPAAFSVVAASPLDTTTQRKLKSVTMYRAAKALSPEARTMHFEKITGAAGDTFMVRSLKGSKAIMLHGDNARAISFNKISFNGEPGQVFRIAHNGSDSSVVIVRSVVKDGVVMYGEELLEPGEVTARYATSDNIKIETDESGKTTVYEIDEKGNKKEIDGYHFGRSGEKSTVIVLRKSKVEDITKEDKKALKEAGVKVEKSEKRELKVEELSYYPNPSNGRFNVSFTLPGKGGATVRVLNSTGREVYRDEVKNTAKHYEKQIDISNWGKGIYYLQVEQGGRTLTKRLLVK